MSYIGQQLVAPNGFRNLSKSDIYYYVARNKKTAKVLLCYFMEKPEVKYLWIGLREFEEGLVNDQIVKVQKPNEYPPWLAVMEGKDPSVIDTLRKNKVKKSNEERVGERYKKIEPLLVKKEIIIESDNPFILIDRYARNCNPTINQKSLRCWFFTYICFGLSKWSLTPAFPNCGTSSRKDEGGKLGRHHRKGKNYGYRMSDVIKETMYAGYSKNKALGRTLKEVYELTVYNEFKCKSRREGENNIAEIYQPGGNPFPSLNQFKYAIDQKIGVKQRQKDLYGETRTRTRLTASKGSYTEYVTHLMERVEADAYYLKERPRGPIDGEPMPPLCVVRIREYLSGYIVGTGFSYGSERAEAYRMALFSMAVSKEYFCSLFGLNINESQWPGIGVPPWLSIDRGPGASKDLIAEFEEKIPLTELAPSYQGQSKAVVESSHPKDLKIEGAPVYKKSNLNYVEMIKRELLRSIKDNETVDVSGRLSPKMINVFPTPINVWNYYDDRFRTDAKPMKFSVAVKNLLVPVTLTLQEDGAYLFGQRYSSDALKESELCEKVIMKGRYEINGYTLGVVARKIWIEYKNKLIEIGIQFNIRTKDSEKYLSIPELEKLDEIRKKHQTQLKDHRVGIELESIDKFESETGKNWYSGSKVRGRISRNSKKSKAEFQDVMSVVQGK